MRWHPQPVLRVSLVTLIILQHLRYEHAIVLCGSVLPVIEYYTLRHLLAKLLHLNLIDCFESLLQKGGVFDSSDKLRFWQIAQSSS